jgi:predicted Fe-Mo cluster-binding NifX family protein
MVILKYMQGSSIMKIAVSAKGKSLDSDVDPRFGRSAGFVLFDTDTANSSYLYNSAQRNITQRTGIQTAQMIAKAGTETLIIGQLGPKAAQVLNKSGIKIYAYRNGNVQEAVQAWQENTLKELSGEAVQAGPGKMGGRGMRGGGLGCGSTQGGQS